MDHFGPWSFCSLGHFGLKLWTKVILTPGHFGSSLDISVSGHFGLRAFCPRKFRSLFISSGDILVHGYFKSHNISILGHFGPWSFWSLGHFDIVTFWSQLILTQGHFDPYCYISVSGHFGPRAFYPWTFWSLFILSWDISVPDHFSPKSFGSWVVLSRVHSNLWSF